MDYHSVSDALSRSTFNDSIPRNSLRTARIIATIGAAYALFGGIITVIGWIFNLPRLTDWAAGGISMFVNTAICAALGGAATLLLVDAVSPIRVWTARTAALIITLFASLTAAEHIFGVDVGIDAFLINRPWGQAAATAPMRMGPPACASFVILGISLLLASRGPRSRLIASHLAIVPVLIALLSMTGYWFGANQLFGVARFTGIAFQTSTMVAALGIATIALVPEFGVAAALRQDDAGGTVFRRLLLPIIVIPLLLGWLRIVGQNMGLYDVAFGTALRSLIEILLFFILLWGTSIRISRHAVAAKTAQSRLGAIVQSSDDAIIAKSLDGVILSWNQGAERIFGFSSPEAVGKHISLIIPNDRLQEETEILARLRRGERIDHFETIRRRKDGTLRHISLTVSPVRGAGGEIVGASKIARDVTDRIQVDEALKRNEQELRILAEERSGLLEAERAARSDAERVSTIKDEFLATLSHELRTPLNAILGWSQLLGSDKLSDDDFQQGTEAIERNARLQTQLIDDLLDMSRIVSGKIRLDVQRVDVVSIVEAAVDSVRPSANAKHIRVRKVIDPHVGQVSGDPTRLQQVLWNLLTNAIKFTPKDGKVDVLLERVNSHLEITVHDSGIGIKPELLPAVFERFRQGDSSTTRSHGGLGLGLSIVKTIVELHGGSVHAKSAGQGQGASFIVRLPLVAVQSDHSRQHPTTAKPLAFDCEKIHLKGVKVLVVDDESDARELVKRVLQECHAEITTASSASDALDLLSEVRPDVIVSDIGMPERDGYEFIRDVRKLSAEKGGTTPAVALTAFARSEDRTRALMAGYQVHLAKPIEPQELLVTVHSVIGRAGTAT